MEFNSIQFLKQVYRGLKNQHNQANFVVCFFVSAGNTKYYLPKNGEPIKSGEQGGPKHYVTDRTLGDMKKSFPHPIKKKEAAEYLINNIDENRERALMDSFNFPSDVPLNREALAYAIAEQFNLFVTEEKEVLEENVHYFFKLFSPLDPKELEEASSYHSRLYNGDDAYITTYVAKDEDVSCYEEFEHTWSIENAGNVTWSGRKLVNVNSEKIGPRTTTPEIKIDTTLPRNAAIVTAKFDARGFEGDFESRWQMQDKDGRDCFATSPKKFNFMIKVSYRVNKTEE